MHEMQYRLYEKHAAPTASEIWRKEDSSIRRKNKIHLIRRNNILNLKVAPHPGLAIGWSRQTRDYFSRRDEFLAKFMPARGGIDFFVTFWVNPKVK